MQGPPRHGRLANAATRPPPNPTQRMHYGHLSPADPDKPSPTEAETTGRNHQSRGFRGSAPRASTAGRPTAKPAKGRRARLTRRSHLRQKPKQPAATTNRGGSGGSAPRASTAGRPTAKPAKGRRAR